MAFGSGGLTRGQYLFGIEPINQLESFATVSDVNSIADKVEDGTFKLVALPTNIKMGTIRRRLNKLLKELTGNAYRRARSRLLNRATKN